MWKNRFAGPDGTGRMEVGDKGEGSGKERLGVTEQSRGCTSSTGSVVHNIAITMCRARRVLASSGGPLCKMYKCLPTTVYT